MQRSAFQFPALAKRDLAWTFRPAMNTMGMERSSPALRIASSQGRYMHNLTVIHCPTSGAY